MPYALCVIDETGTNLLRGRLYAAYASQHAGWGGGDAAGLSTGATSARHCQGHCLGLLST